VPGGAETGLHAGGLTFDRLSPPPIAAKNPPSAMGPDGLDDSQSNSFGTNGQSLLVLTRNSELNHEA